LLIVESHENHLQEVRTSSHSHEKASSASARLPDTDLHCISRAPVR
jgi:hypothetical protein